MIERRPFAPPDPEWHTLVAEPVIDPERPIVDPHHHLWDLRTFNTEPHVNFEQKVYLCEDISNDITSAGHNVVQTVFAQCGAFYRADGPEPMRCIGETEFVHAMAHQPTFVVCELSLNRTKCGLYKQRNCFLSRRDTFAIVGRP